MSIDYSTVTELPGSKVTKLQLRRAYSRYKFGSDLSEGKDVLEVACGGGQGLGLIAKAARKVVGGDCDAVNLTYAQSTYSDDDKISIVELDAHNLLFENKSFDVIILYEAIYYLKSPDVFLEECKRILRNNGMVIICSANKNWPDFNPSPYSNTYYSVPEMKALFNKHGFDVKFYGGFPDFNGSLSAKIRSMLKRISVKFNIIPKTMKGKVLFKRLFFGGLVKLPRILEDGIVEYERPRSIPDDVIDTIHTQLFAVATLI